MKHGAKVKRCSSEGCTKFAQKGGVCIRHGAKHERCRTEGCTNQVRNELNTNDAAVKDAEVLLKREEYVIDMVHTATITKNLPLSHRVLDQSLIRLLRLLISVILQARSAYLKKL